MIICQANKPNQNKLLILTAFLIVFNLMAAPATAQFGFSEAIQLPPTKPARKDVPRPSQPPLFAPKTEWQVIGETVGFLIDNFSERTKRLGLLFGGSLSDFISQCAGIITQTAGEIVCQMENTLKVEGAIIFLKVLHSTENYLFTFSEELERIRKEDLISRAKSEQEKWYKLPDDERARTRMILYAKTEFLFKLADQLKNFKRELQRAEKIMKDFKEDFINSRLQKNQKMENYRDQLQEVLERIDAVFKKIEEAKKEFYQEMADSGQLQTKEGLAIVNKFLSLFPALDIDSSRMIISELKERGLDFLYNNRSFLLVLQPPMEVDETLLELLQKRLEAVEEKLKNRGEKTKSAEGQQGSLHSNLAGAFPDNDEKRKRLIKLMEDIARKEAELTGGPEFDVAKLKGRALARFVKDAIGVGLEGGGLLTQLTVKRVSGFCDNLFKECVDQLKDVKFCVEKAGAQVVKIRTLDEVLRGAREADEAIRYLEAYSTSAGQESAQEAVRTEARAREIIKEMPLLDRADAKREIEGLGREIRKIGEEIKKDLDDLEADFRKIKGAEASIYNQMLIPWFYEQGTLGWRYDDNRLIPRKVPEKVDGGTVRDRIIYPQEFYKEISASDWRKYLMEMGIVTPDGMKNMTVYDVYLVSIWINLAKAERDFSQLNENLQAAKAKYAEIYNFLKRDSSPKQTDINRRLIFINDQIEKIKAEKDKLKNLILDEEQKQKVLDSQKFGLESIQK